MYGYVSDTNSWVDVFGLEILDDAWKVVQSHMNKLGTTVLGHLSDDSNPEFESYIDKAKRKCANYFDMVDEMWNKVKLAGQDPWILNTKFFDDAITRGDKMILNVKRSEIRGGSYLEDEITY